MITTANGVTYKPEGWGGTLMEGATKKSAPKRKAPRTPTMTTCKKSTKKKKETQLGMGLRLPKMAILGERPDNALRISNTDYDFELETMVPEILAKYPDCTLLSGLVELELDAKESRPVVFIIMMPTGTKSPPPLVAFHPKSEHGGKFRLDDLSQHSLSWEMYEGQPRVFYLKDKTRRTKASLKTLDADHLYMHDYRSLWTLVPSKDLKRKEDRLDVRMVNFSMPNLVDPDDPVDCKYEKGDGGVANFCALMADQYSKALGPDAESNVRAALTQAFVDARPVLQGQADLLESLGYSHDLLDSIKTIKIYPVGAEIPTDCTGTFGNTFYPRACELL